MKIFTNFFKVLVLLIISFELLICAPEISISDANITEGNSGTKTMNFTVSLNNPPASGSVKVDLLFSTTADTADSADFTSISSVLANDLLKSDFPKTFAVTVNGDTTIENNETFYLNIVFGIDNTMGAILVDPQAVGTIIDDDNTSGGGSGTLPYSAGSVDVVDIYQSTAGTPFYQPILKTKIAAKTGMTLDAVYLGSDMTANAVFTAADMPVFLYVYDPIADTVTRLYEQANPNEPLAAVISKGSISGTSPLFTIPAFATKEAYIIMRYIDYQELMIEGGPNCLGNSSTGANAVPGMPSCVSSDVQYLDAFHQEAYDRCKVEQGEPCKPEHHGYSGGGDPSYPGYNPIYDHKYGCYECTLGTSVAVRSVDNFAIRPNNFDNNITANQLFTAGVSYPLTFNANQFGGVGTLNYNETEHISFVIDANVSDSSKVCQEMSIHFTPDINFTDGTVSNNYTLNNVGDFNVTMHEIVGAEYAIIDADDTNESIRLITPSMKPIRVVPDHFSVDGNLTNGSNGFTYLSNFEEYNTTQSRTVSASLDLNISARRADNNITSNYTSTCYAKDGNLTLSLANAISVTPPASDGNAPLSKIVWYHNTPDINGSVDLNTTATEYRLPFANIQFDSNETNGTAIFNYKINFDRNITKVVNPFMVIVTDMNLTDTDNISGINSLDSNATFLFGRTHAARQRYDVPVDAPYTANIYFENYCFGAGCTKILLPNGATSERVDDVRWFINREHNSTNDGVAGTVTQKGGAGIVSATSLNYTLTYKPTTNLTYSGNRGYPYKTTMENNASDWLIQNEYNPSATTNEFQVEFDRAGNWSGEHETNTTTKSTGGVKTNRRIVW